MTNLNADEILNIVNKEKEKKGLNTYIPTYPTFKMKNNKLYITLFLINDKDNVWDIESNIKPEYWVLLDLKGNILEFNKTSENDFVENELIKKNIETNKEAISKYEIEKALKYENYILEDIKQSNLPLQDKINRLLNNNINVDEEEINVNEYSMSQIEEPIKNKIKDLVSLIIGLKYETIITYYKLLFEKVINEYNETNNINKEIIKICNEILNNYYDGIMDFNNLSNIN